MCIRDRSMTSSSSASEHDKIWITDAVIQITRRIIILIVFIIYTIVLSVFLQSRLQIILSLYVYLQYKNMYSTLKWLKSDRSMERPWKHYYLDFTIFSLSFCFYILNPMNYLLLRRRHRSSYCAVERNNRHQWSH